MFLKDREICVFGVSHISLGEGRPLKAGKAQAWIQVELRWTSHPVIVTIRTSNHYSRVFLYIPIIPPLQGGGSSKRGTLQERGVFAVQYVRHWTAQGVRFKGYREWIGIVGNTFGTKRSDQGNLAPKICSPSICMHLTPPPQNLISKP